jgi:hypothetical protein
MSSQHAVLRVGARRSSAAAILFAISFCIGAEEGLVGSYRGNFTTVTMHGQVPFGIDLDIEYAEKGVLRATMTEYGHRAEAGALCNGKYDMRGKYEGNNLKLGTKTGGDGGTCARFFELHKDGDSLVGTTAKGQRVELHRQ